MFKPLIALVVFWPSTLHAENLGLTVSKGIEETPGNYVELHYNSPILNCFLLEGTAGYFSEPDRGIFSVGAGLDVPVHENVYVQGVAGPAYLTKETDRLGGNFQFLLKGRVGITVDRFKVGALYSHISSAGIYEPNQGNDYLGLELGVDF